MALNMTKQHDTLAQRLSIIITKLNCGEKLTVNELSEEFNVSKRTIQRDIKEKLSGIPIEKNGDYYRMESYALGKLSFEDIKNFATLCGIKSLYPSLSNEFITEILNTKINSVYLIKNQGFENISLTINYFENLSTAIIKHIIISFEYKNKYRNVNPYKLINNNGIWYLLADEDNNLKTFTFSKIEKFTWKDDIKTFTPKKEFLNQISKNDLNWFTTDKLIEVTLQIDNEVKAYFQRKDMFPNKKIVEEYDTYFTISTKISYDDEILILVKSWIPYIKIIKPLYLKEKMNTILYNYLSQSNISN